MAGNASIAFFFWLTPLPIATLCTLWQLTQPNMNNAGYVLPAFAIVMVLAVTIAALAVGALTRTAGASLMGVLMSVPVAFMTGSAAVNLLEDGQQSRAKTQPLGRTGPKYVEMTRMIPILLSGNKSTIAHAVAQRKLFTVPWMMCVLAHDAEGDDGRIFGEGKNNAVSVAALLQITETVIEMNLAREVEQSSLSLAFQGMVRRNALKQLPAWIGLWDKAHQFENAKTVAFDTMYSEDQDNCNWGSTSQLADDLVEAWGDDGINVWIATGHTFVEGQREIVLRGAKQVATFNNIIAKGVKFEKKELPEACARFNEPTSANNGPGPLNQHAVGMAFKRRLCAGGNTDGTAGATVWRR